MKEIDAFRSSVVIWESGQKAREAMGLGKKDFHITVGFKKVRLINIYTVFVADLKDTFRAIFTIEQRITRPLCLELDLER